MQGLYVDTKFDLVILVVTKPCNLGGGYHSFECCTASNFRVELKFKYYSISVLYK